MNEKGLEKKRSGPSGTSQEMEEIGGVWQIKNIPNSNAPEPKLETSLEPRTDLNEKLKHRRTPEGIHEFFYPNGKLKMRIVLNGNKEYYDEESGKMVKLTDDKNNELPLPIDENQTIIPPSLEPVKKPAQTEQKVIEPVKIEDQKSKERAEKIAELKETIESASRIIEVNLREEEKILRRLAEIRGGTTEKTERGANTKQNKPLESENDEKIASLESRLKSWWLMPKKRRELKAEMSNLKIEKDKEKNPFKYYLLDQLHPKNLRVIFGRDPKDISVEIIKAVMGEDGKELKFWDTSQIIFERDYAVMVTSNGFYLRLSETNSDIALGKKVVERAHPKAVYDLVGPDGLMDESDFDYESGVSELHKKAKEYQEQQIVSFEKTRV